ncbi:hypothetical protein [Acaryochloris thomasi]|nr:hypothetical protein [Acaryochloris thomasi]
MNRLPKFPVLLCGLLVAAAMPAVAQPLQESQQEQTEVTVAHSDNRQVHQARGLIFETPTGFSEVQALKNDTVGVVSDDRRITVRVLPLTPDTLSFLNMEDAELINYVKYFFLGINSPSTNYPQRRFFERPVTGELQIQRNQSGFITTEIYLVPLAAGHKVAIAFEADDQLPISEVEETINTVAQSLREDPEVLEKRMKKLKKQK